MKIVCTKENLKKALNLSTRVISATPTLPILNNLLFKIESGQLLISATNLEIAVKTRVGGQITEPGEITVPAKTIAEFINNSTEEKFTLHTKGNDLLVKTERSESQIKGLPAEEFPLIPEVQPLQTISLSAAELAEGLGQVAFAAAFSETQPELSGVVFDFKGGQLRLAATDRYRLAERVVPLSQSVPSAQRVIVPNRAVAELVRVLNETLKTVEVVISENQILFRTPTTELISRLIEGEYPDYQQIVPQKFLSQAKVKNQELTSALKLAGLFAQENNNVELQINKGTGVVLKASSQRTGSHTTQLAAEAVGENNKVIFNYRYILDCLNNLSSPVVTLKLINSSSPAMIVPETEENYFYLVMPIKI